VELHHRRLLRSANGAGGTAFVEPQQGIKLVQGRDMDPEGVGALLTDGALAAAFHNHGRLAQAHQHQVGGGAGLLIAAEEGFDISLY
jgi:hypothetical protein